MIISMIYILKQILTLLWHNSSELGTLGEEKAETAILYVAESKLGESAEQITMYVIAQGNIIANLKTLQLHRHECRFKLA